MGEVFLKLIKISALSTSGMNFFVYNEGSNPTGTHKDRIAQAHIKDCVKKGLDHITVASCGNYGVSIATFAAKKNITSTIFIPSTFDSPRISEMEYQGAKVIRLPLSYEVCVEKSRAYAQLNNHYDANPGGVNSEFQIDVYGEMTKEILSSLPDKHSLAALSVSVSNGTTLAGLFRGVGSSVKIIGGTTHQNPIYTSYSKNLSVPETLDEKDLKETEVNEPLINWKSLDAAEALNALKCSRGAIYAATDEELLKVQKLLMKEGISAHPAGCAGVFGMMEHLKKEELSGSFGTVIAVITSREYALRKNI